MSSTDKSHSAPETLGLVRIEKLGEDIFPDKESRPSVRTLRNWTRQRVIPSLKIGRLRYYDPSRVLAALRQKFEEV